jgi:hypothetical protein
MKDFKFIRINPTDPTAPQTAEYNDFMPDANGNPEIVEGADRRLQDLIKICTTTLKSNPVFPTYGTLIASAVGKVDSVSNQILADSVIAAVSFLAEIENPTDPAERIQGIKKCTVQKDAGDPTRKILVLEVVLQNGQILEWKRRV